MNGWQGLFSVPSAPPIGSLGNINTGPGGWPGAYAGNIPGLPGTQPFSRYGPVPADLNTALGFGPPPSAADLASNAAFGNGNGMNKGWFGVDGLGKNIGTLQLGIGTLAAGANIWNSLQQNKLAKASFNHQKGLLDTNLANQIKAFNLQLDDKLRSRQVVEGTSDASREEARKRWEARDERRG